MCHRCQRGTYVVLQDGGRNPRPLLGDVVLLQAGDCTRSGPDTRTDALSCHLPVKFAPLERGGLSETSQAQVDR